VGKPYIVKMGILQSEDEEAGVEEV